MVTGHRGHHGHLAVLNVFNIEEGHVQILHQGNQKGDIVSEETCKAEIVQMDFAKVK